MNAIVSTVKEPGKSLVSFIKYHLHIGFDRIFLFFDDPLDPAIADAISFSKVTVVKTDEDLRKKWAKTRILRENMQYSVFIDTEVMARQLLNVEIAIQMSRDLNVDWLLHIDHDELFFPSSYTVCDHFNTLSKRGISAVRYHNHEAVAEKFDYEDPFQEANLFKRNPALLNKEQTRILNILCPVRNFLFYANGKSAGDVRQNIYPLNVHSFNNAVSHTSISDPSILHYSIIGFENFLNKYRILGEFDNKWFGINDIRKEIPFHIECRDVVNNKDENKTKDFYVSNVMPDQAKLQLLLNEGIYFRTAFPKDSLLKCEW